MSYLHHHHLAPPEVRVRALESRYVNMDMLSATPTTRARRWPACHR